MLLQLLPVPAQLKFIMRIKHKKKIRNLRELLLKLEGYPTLMEMVELLFESSEAHWRLFNLLCKFVVDLVEVFVWTGILDDFVEIEKRAFVANKLKDVIFERSFDNLVVLGVLNQQRLKHKLETFPLIHVNRGLGTLKLITGFGTNDFISYRVNPVFVKLRIVSSIYSYTLVMSLS